MKSKANLKGHPIHPILVGFPIAFFVGTLVFDLLAFVNDSGMLWQTGKYLEIAGIVSAAMAAVPGIIDYIFTVPPESSAKSRAAKHGILNVSMLIIFIVALIIREEDASMSVILLEGGGVVLLSISGWLS